MHDLGKGLRLLGPDDYRRMRWKNGQGWTTEIAVSPVDAGLNGKPFDWRISMADIEEDGEFSSFPGYDRTILVAEGKGMELNFDAAPSQRLAEPYVPFGFRGEWHTRCRLLNSPVRDFNVMSARARWQHHCDIARGGKVTPARDRHAEILIAHCLRGHTEISGPAGLQYELQAQETLICEGAAIPALELGPASAATVLAVISLKPGGPA